MSALGRGSWSGYPGYVVRLVGLVGAGLFFSVVCIDQILGAAGSAAARAKAHQSLAGDITLSVVSLIVVIGCVAGAIRIEHQLRRHQPIARAWVEAVPSSRSPLPWSRLRRGRRYSPTSLAVRALLFTGAAIGLMVATVNTHAEADRSNRVQHEGIARAGTVTSVHNTWHSSRGGGYYTGTASVSFLPPVSGRTTAVVHYPGYLEGPLAARYSVLLDPSNPGYAEFPGSPSVRTSGWILMLVFTLGVAALDCFFLLGIYRLWQYRRRGPVMPGPY